MTIEDEVFQRKRFVPDRLLLYGFSSELDGYRYATGFLNGDFMAILHIDQSGRLVGKVEDCTNNEEYIQMRMENFNGAYVNTVRSAYKDLLKTIAEQCCKEVFFVSDQTNRIADSVFREFRVRPDFPWGRSPYDNAATFRHTDTRKWFALVMHIKRGLLLKNEEKTTVDVMNLKIDPNLRTAHLKTKGIYPAFHMNHEKWISAVLDDTLSDESMMELIRESYRMTQHK